MQKLLYNWAGWFLISFTDTVFWVFAFGNNMQIFQIHSIKKKTRINLCRELFKTIAGFSYIHIYFYSFLLNCSWFSLIFISVQYCAIHFNKLVRFVFCLVTNTNFMWLISCTVMMHCNNFISIHICSLNAINIFALYLSS